MRSRYLVAITFALAAAAPLSAQSVRAGIEAWQKSDYSAAVAIWRPLAESGDADASFNLGQAYRLGRGVPQNLLSAQDWFERAARKDHLAAQTTLGLMLFGNGNRIAGLRWLKQAADKGEPRALLMYGTAMFNGDSVPRDPVLGYAYVSRAASMGLPAAKDILAELDTILPEEERAKAMALAAVAASSPTPTPSPNAMVKKMRPPKPKQVASSNKPSTPAAPSVVKNGPWRIQLGAFSKRSSAEALFAKLSASSSLSGRSAFYIPYGKITRLQVGPFPTSAAAQAACSALASQACFPTLAK